MIDLNKLEELAREATAGPWEWDGRTVDADDGYVHIPECSYIVGTISLAGHYEGYQEDCDYIAAANPSVMLDLIALIRKQEAELASARAESANSGTFLGAAATVDTPEFREILRGFLGPDGNVWPCLIAHIDAHVAQAVARARELGIADGRTLMLKEIGEQAAVERAKIASQPGDGELPALPERDGDWTGDDWFTADSMRDYGRLCLATRHSAPVGEVMAVPDVIREALEATFEQRPGYLTKVSAAIRALNKTGGA